MLLLSSYDRMRRYISSLTGTALTDSKAQKQMIVNWIATVSKQIETYLGRILKIAQYTHYFDTPTERTTEFFVKACPITTLTSVYIDGEGLYDGGESEVDDCYVGKNGDSIILPSAPSVVGKKTIRAIYTGGLAYSGTRSLYTVENVSGTWAVGKYMQGGTSEAVGIVKAATATTITAEVLYGIFEEDEVLTEYDDEDLGTASNATATISAVTQQSLVEQYPDIIRAAEIQIRHYWKHKDDFELSSSSRDSTNTRQRELNERNIMLPETLALLRPYRRTEP